MNEAELISARDKIVGKLENLFDNKAIEAHLFGSLARGDADAYSDVDIWYIFKDEDYGTVYDNRFAYYARLGTIIHSCEPPQNAPNGGLHTALLVQIGDAITVVDVYLCKLSTAFITEESKKLFGIDLPLGTAGFNTQKVQVGETYRIDFFIGFIFNTIKKIARKKENPLADVLREYEALYKNYNISVEPVEIGSNNLETLENIIENIKKVATEKQKEALTTVLTFARKILS
jgi:predicted nucleotidyltransferase